MKIWKHSLHILLKIQGNWRCSDVAAVCCIPLAVVLSWFVLL